MSDFFRMFAVLKNQIKMNEVKMIRKGDNVIFLGTDHLVEDSDGNDIHENLKVGEIYQVENSFILTIQIKGKLFLKENFRKI